MPAGLKPFLDPSDPFADGDRERCEVEELARNFEVKYVSVAVSSEIIIIIAYRTVWCLCVSCAGWRNKEEKKRQNTGSN